MNEQIKNLKIKEIDYSLTDGFAYIVFTDEITEHTGKYRNFKIINS